VGRLCSIPPLVAIAAALAAAPSAHAFGPDPTTATARFRFAVLNDVHVTVEDLDVSHAQLRRAVDEINGFASEIGFVLVAGDLGQAADSTALHAELQAARDELDRLLVPYRVAIGNHDVTSGGDDRIFRTLFGPTSQRFAYGGVQFVFLNTVQTQSSSSISTAALDSFDLRLAEIQRTDPLVVVSHHPLGPITPYGATNRSAVWARVDSFALRGVISGHWHGVFEEQRNGAWYCTSAALAVHRENNDDTPAKGYRLVTVLPDYSLASRFYELGSPPNFIPQPPVLEQAGNRYAIPGRQLRLQIAARNDAGAPLNFAALGLPAGAGFDPAQRLFSWTPTPSQAGFHPGIRFVAADANGADTLSLGVRVLDDGCLYEDFEPQQLLWEPAGGNWTVTGGELVQSISTGGSYSYTTPGNWSDFYLEADFQHDSGVGYAGLVFRYVNNDNNYYVWNDGARIQLRRRVAGSASTIGYPVTVGAITGRHHVRVEAIGPSIKVYWDGSLRLDVADSTFVTGRVGVVCSQAAARFDNLVATGCAGFADRAPVLQPIGPLTAYSGAPLTFDLTAVDPEGDPLSYVASNLPTGATFDPSSAHFSWTPGTTQIGLWKGVRFEVSDGELQDAEVVSFTVIDTSRACLYESFSGPGGGSPGGGSTSGVGSYVSPSSVPVIATFGDEPMYNFVQQARVRVEGSGGGIAFRIADDSNYYYLAAWPGSDTVELYKVTDGTSYRLAGGADVTGRTEEWHLYRVEAEFARLRVWIDDVLVFDHVDTDPGTGTPHLSGRPGLWVRDATLYVDDLVVYDCSSSVVDTSDPETRAPRPQLSGLVAFPNPFNPQTTVRFELGRSGFARADIYDVAGRRVRGLLAADLPMGRHELSWNGSNDEGHAVGSGVYFLRVTTGDQTASQRLVLLK
jgi:Calcineurin-like phosphoesterase/Putative Ig domain/FlgD Ig-like domain/3-keto-disaccharide hydrolase